MVIIGSDHSGTMYKKNIIEFLEKENVEYVDVTINNEPDDDYPDVANIICNKVLEDKENLGIAICGTGIGISIACNKIKGIRAAVCTDEYMAKMSRIDNDANVLCLGSRLKVSSDVKLYEGIVQAFLNSEFGKGRHQRRLQKIIDIEKGGN